MNINEAMKTIPADDSLKEVSRQSKMEHIVGLLKKGDALELTKIIHNVSRLELTSMINKLERYKYEKYPLTKVAIAKLKDRRGY